VATVAARISTVWHGLSLLSSLAKNAGVSVHLHRVHYEQARPHAGPAASPSVVITDGQSVKTTERGGARDCDAHKRVKGRKPHILVDTFGLLVANRVKPADTSDRRAGALLHGGLSALFPRIRTAIRVRQEIGGHAA
jgi:putative transposase